jgi:hypothetical protein
MEVEKMKRFLSVCFLVVLSILLTPLFSDHYSAKAGRIGAGNIQSAYCDCGLPAPPACYEDGTTQLCSTEYGGNLKQAAPTDTKSPKNTLPVDGASLGLTIFVAAYLFRRFIM